MARVASYAKIHRLIRAGFIVYLYRKSVATCNVEEIRYRIEPFSEDYIRSVDLELALEALIDEKCVLIVDEYSNNDRVNFTEGDILITNEGIYEVDQAIAKGNGYIADCYKYGDDWLSQKLQDAYSECDTLSPIRYREDRVIELDANQSKRNEVISKIDNLLTLINNSNSIRASINDDTIKAIQNIRIGKEELKKDRTTIIRIESLFYGSLTYIATKLLDAPISEAAHAVWSSIKLLMHVPI